MTPPAEPAQSSAAPTLELLELGLRRAGEAARAPLSLRSNAQRLGLLGDWLPLVQALTGRARLESGQAFISGCPLEAAISEGVLGFAACDLALPATFTVTQYLQQAARLSHGSVPRAKQEATRALERFGLGQLNQQPLSLLTLYQQRALGIAAACATDPTVVWLDSPQRGLDAAAADFLAGLCTEVARGSRLIVSNPVPSTPSAERSLLDNCQELFVLEQGALAVQGTPARVFADTRRYLLTVSGVNQEPLREALSAMGCSVQARSASGAYAVELPEPGNTDLLLDSALAHGLVVLQLEPLFGSA